MEDGESVSATWSPEAPESVRKLSTMSNPDYTDGFTANLPAPPTLSAAQLVHAAFESSPLWLRLATPLAQRYVLGFRIDRRSSPEHPLGWHVTGAGDNWLRVEASSSFLSGQVVGVVEDRTVTIGTFVRYDRQLGRLVWRPVSLIHRQVGITLLRSAAQATTAPAV